MIYQANSNIVSINFGWVSKNQYIISKFLLSKKISQALIQLYISEQITDST